MPKGHASSTPPSDASSLLPEDAPEGGSPEYNDHRRRWKAIGARWAPRLAAYGLALLLWNAASGTLISEALLPSPLRILQEMESILASGTFWVHFNATIAKLAVGFGVAYVLGCAIGVLVRYPWWEGFFRHWITITLTTPALVWVLIAAVTFGFSPIGPILAVVVASVPFVTVNVAEGTRALPRELVDMARAFSVREARVVRQVLIPFITPFLLTAARYGFSNAWKTVTLAELFGSARGIGFMMRSEYRAFNMVGLLAWILFFSVFALILEKVLLQGAIRRASAWRRNETRATL